MMQKQLSLKLLGGILSFMIALLSGCSSLSFSTGPTINTNLTPPHDIRFLADVNTIGFEWKLVQDPNIMGYYIYRKEARGQKFKKIATINSRFNTHYADNNLQAGTAYDYYFVAFDKQGRISTQSQILNTSTLSIAAVNYVEAISNYPRKVKILWSPHQDVRVVGYVVQRKGNNGKWREVGNVKSRLLVEFLDTNLEDGTTYTYQVLAYNAKKSLSLPSVAVSATTKPKPTPITNFQATMNQPKQVTLSWDLHPNEEVTSYKILRSGFISSLFSVIATIPNHINSYQDLIKKDGERYQYKIVATDKDGIDSLESGPITGATLAVPSTPNITYARIENGSVILRWAPTDDRVKEYVVYKRDSTFFGKTLRYNNVIIPEFIDAEIQVKKRYNYRVSAIDENGLESRPSKEVTLALPQ